MLGFIVAALPKDDARRAAAACRAFRDRILGAPCGWHGWQREVHGWLRDTNSAPSRHAGAGGRLRLCWRVGDPLTPETLAAFRQWRGGGVRPATMESYTVHLRRMLCAPPPCPGPSLASAEYYLSSRVSTLQVCKCVGRGRLLALQPYCRLPAMPYQRCWISSALAIAKARG